MTMTFPQTLPVLRAGLVVAALATCPAASAQQTPADRDDAALAYAQCMRANGYAEFPDPTPDGGIRFLIDPANAPRFQKAAAACHDLAPEGLGDDAIAPAELEALVKLAQCVRENGIPDFPDPDAHGRFDPSNIGGKPDVPRLEAAMAACRDKVGFPQGGRIVIGG
jgi:hypothetical protein